MIQIMAQTLEHIHLKRKGQGDNTFFYQLRSLKVADKKITVVRGCLIWRMTSRRGRNGRAYREFKNQKAENLNLFEISFKTSHQVLLYII